MKLTITLLALGSLCAAFAAARDYATAATPQSGSSASASQSVPALEQARSQDNVHGLELVLSAGGGVRLFEFGPFTPPAPYAAHFRGQAVPVRVVLRAEILGTTRDQPFAAGAGSTWSLSLPDSWFSSVPGARYTVLAWEAGAGLGVADEAVFSYGVEL